MSHLVRLKERRRKKKRFYVKLHYYFDYRMHAAKVQRRITFFSYKRKINFIHWTVLLSGFLNRTETFCSVLFYKFLNLDLQSRYFRKL